MAVPKRKTSRSDTRHRRSHWKATAPDPVPITVNGRELFVPRRLVARDAKWQWQVAEQVPGQQDGDDEVGDD